MWSVELVLPGLKLIKRQSNFDNLQVEEKNFSNRKFMIPSFVCALAGEGKCNLLYCTFLFFLY